MDLLIIWLIGIAIVFPIAYAVYAYLDDEKIEEIGDLFDDGFYAFVAGATALFWPLCLLGAVIFLPFYGMIRATQWILFEVLKPKENV